MLKTGKRCNMRAKGLLVRFFDDNEMIEGRYYIVRQDPEVARCIHPKEAELMQKIFRSGDETDDDAVRVVSKETLLNPGGSRA